MVDRFIKNKLLTLSSIEKNFKTDHTSSYKIQINENSIGGDYWKLSSSGFTKNNYYKYFNISFGGYGYSIGTSDIQKYNDNTNSNITDLTETINRYQGSGFILEDFIFLCCGYDLSLIQVSNKNQIYNPYSKIISNKTNTSYTRQDPFGMSLSNGGFIIGGNNASSNNYDYSELYNITTDSWTTKKELPSSNKTPSGFVLKTYGYITNGTYSDVASSEIIKYDISLNNWNIKQNGGDSKIYSSSFSLNGYGYKFSGCDTSLSTLVSSVFQYNDDIDTWMSKTNKNSSKFASSSFTLNNFGYDFHGTTAFSEGSQINEIEQYRNFNLYEISKSFKLSHKSPKKILISANLNGIQDSIPIKMSSNGGLTWRHCSGNEDSVLKFDEAISSIIETTSAGVFDYKLKIGLVNIDIGPAGEYITTKANTLTATYGHTSFSLNGFGYKMLGTPDNTGSNALNSVEQFNTALNNWSLTTNHTTSKVYLSSGVTCGLGISVGGKPNTSSTSYSSEVNVYNDMIKSWTAVANSTTVRASASTHSLIDLSYTTGGRSATSTYSSATHRYSYASNSNTTLGNIPATRWGSGYTVSSDLLFIFNGGNASFFNNNTYICNQILAGTWLSGTNTPTSKYFATSLNINDKVYNALGHIASTSDYTSEIHTYVGGNNGYFIQRINAPIQIAYLSSFGLNKKGYFINGIDESATIYSSVYQYNTNYSFPVITATMEVKE